MKNFEDYPVEELIEITCKEYSVPVNEYYVGINTAKIADVRHTVIFIMRKQGLSNGEIELLTGFSQPRIVNSVHYFKKKNMPESIVRNIINELDEKTNFGQTES